MTQAAASQGPERSSRSTFAIDVRRWRALGYVAVFVFCLLICLHFGRRGLMPIDQSIIFDAGWRIMSGQVPYVDFVTPVGVVPGYMQAGFFWIFGVTWFAYVLHSAVINGVFGVLVMRTLSYLGLPYVAAFLCGIATGVFAYTPMGTPYSDQHSYFFVVVALFLAAYGLYAPGIRPWVRDAAFGLLPLTILCAAFSKQSPGLPGVLLLVPLVFGRSGSEWSLRRRLLAITGGAIAVAAVLSWALSDEAVRGNFVTYFFQIPQEEVARRGLTAEVAALGLFGQMVHDPAALLRATDLLQLRWFLLLGGVVAVVAANQLIAADLSWVVSRNGDPAEIAARRADSRRLASSAQAALQNVALAGMSYFLMAVFVSHTINQAQNGVALLPLAVGATVSAALWLTRAWTAVTLPGRLLRGQLLVVAGAAGLYLFGTASFQFHNSVNRTRYVNDMAYDHKQAIKDSSELPASMGFLQWFKQGAPYSARDLAGLLAYFQSHEGNFLIAGDSVFIYGLARRPSVNFNLWYHPGLAMPVEGRFAGRFERKFLQNLARFRVRYVVVESESTWAGFHPLRWTPLATWMAVYHCLEESNALAFRIFVCDEAN